MKIHIKIFLFTTLDMWASRIQKIKVNGYFEENIKNKYLLNTSSYQWKKKIMKKYEELWSKIKDLICSVTKNSDYHDEKYMKIKFNSDDVLPLN